MVQESGVLLRAYHEVDGGPLNGVGIAKALVSTLKLARGTLQAWQLMRRTRPDALLLTGGWANVPLALAAWVRRLPTLVYLPDIEPALTIKTISRFASTVAITAPDSARYFREGQSVVTGYPLRQAVLEAQRAQAQTHFGLVPDLPTLLVFGGSRGARSLNQALSACLPEVLEVAQVIHITGTLDWENAQSRLPSLSADQRARYHAFAYLHREMGLALAGADIALSRSGASVLGEFTHFGLPSLLVPYPHAWRYQKVNADYLVERGAALRLDDERLSETLLPTLRDLLKDAARLAHMRASALALRTDGADNIARLWLDMAQAHSAKGRAHD